MKFFISGALSLLLLACSQHNRNVTYPEQASMLRIGGTVSIIYNINSQGITEDVRVLKAEPPGVFEKLLLNDARGWRFEKGKPLRNQILTVHYDQK